MNIMMQCFLIFIAKTAEKSIQAIETVFTVKNQKLYATILAFVECLIWGVVVSSVIDGLNTCYPLLLSYCFGYAFGIYVGSVIENKIAIGTSTVMVVVPAEYEQPVKVHLTSNHQGFTILQSSGATDGDKRLFIIVIPRKDVSGIMRKISRITQNESFVIASEINNYFGGHGTKGIQR